MNDNYTIPAFAEPITDLPDTPSLEAAELKRRFQAPAEEIRQAHNALAECVEGITSATYPDTVTEDMLTDALADKINGKADQTDLDAEIEALETLTETVAQKCQIAVGQYSGDLEESQFIEVGFTPSAVLVVDAEGTMHYEHNLGNNTFAGGLVISGEPLQTRSYEEHKILEICDNGFMAYYTTFKVGSSTYTVAANQGLHYYIAFK